MIEQYRPRLLGYVISIPPRRRGTDGYGYRIWNQPKGFSPTRPMWEVLCTAAHTSMLDSHMAHTQNGIESEHEDKIRQQERKKASDRLYTVHTP